jgi:hypothetical protein
LEKRKLIPLRTFLLLLPSLWLLIALGEEDVPSTRLFDTGVPAPASLTREALARQIGWRQVPEDTTNHPFSGDVLLMNDKLAVLLRKQGLGPEVYTKTADSLKQRAALCYLGSASSSTGLLEGLKVVENTSAGVTVEATAKDAAGAVLTFCLTAGEAILRMESSQSGGFLEMRSMSRYVVVPDYFGNDMVYSPAGSRDRCLPAENFCLSLLDGRDAMLMSVWQSNEQDVWLRGGSAKVGESSTRIRCLKGKRIWLAFFETPSIWQVREASNGDWKPPFPAKWRCSLTSESGVAKSWDTESGAETRQKLDKYQAPLISYPLDRSTTTPLTATCPTDVMRNTLGVGPCQYILSCEALGAQGDPTPNSVMGWVEKQYEQSKQVKAAEDIRERLDFMARHIADARSRIERYAGFSLQIRKELAGKQDQFVSILADLERAAAAGLAPTASAELGRQLAGQVAALPPRADAVNDCRRLGQELRLLGAVQDRALAQCRMAVRRLAALGRELGADPSQDVATAQRVQRSAEQMLRNK